jgi:hypothetical protein
LASALRRFCDFKLQNFLLNWIFLFSTRLRGDITLLPINRQGIDLPNSNSKYGTSQVQVQVERT